MDYKEFEVQHFLQDEYFISWVLNPDEGSSHFWQQWLVANPEKRETVQQASELVASISYEKRDVLSDTEYSEILERLLKANQKKNAQGFRWRVKHTLQLAASIAILCVAYFMLSIEEKGTEKITYTETLVKTQMGQKKTVGLPDGTLIVLNAGSTLKYKVPFTSDKRRVSLIGEAFFDVAHNEKKPFIIQTAGVETKVLGTSFNVRGYPDDSQVSVAVVSGKVQIRASGAKDRILMPNEMGTYSASDHRIRLSSFDRDKTTGWTRGILSFENESLPEIFEQLERWYGVNIQIEKGVALDGKYSGRYINEPLETVLKGLSFTSHFKYEISKKQLTIYESD
ncbi:MAG: FecR domain-containing protein [Cyclobacteriaceae bacterium]|nr:FecR domain-containing protein [Cyclobacteriaceae bacterium HetDA_MAG_MS6]